jgi:hypothetical protein
MDKTNSKQYSKISDKSTKELLERETLKCELIEEMYSKQIDTLMKQVIHLETQLAIKNMQLVQQPSQQPERSTQQPNQQPVPQHVYNQPSIQMLNDQNTRSRKSSVKPPGIKKVETTGVPQTKSEAQKPKINWPVIDDIPDDPELKKEHAALEQTENTVEDDTDHEDMYYIKN